MAILVVIKFTNMPRPTFYTPLTYYVDEKTNTFQMRYDEEGNETGIIPYTNVQGIRIHKNVTTENNETYAKIIKNRENRKKFVSSVDEQGGNNEFTSKELWVAKKIVNTNYECDDVELSAQLLIDFAKQTYPEEFKEMME